MMPRAVAVAIIVPLLVGLAAGDLISEPAPTPAVVAPVPATAPCAAALESTETQAIGAFVPQCDEGGGYEPRQCSGSTGYCWCVDAEGTAISDELPSWEEGASTAEDCAALRESTLLPNLLHSWVLLFVVGTVGVLIIVACVSASHQKRRSSKQERSQRAHQQNRPPGSAELSQLVNGKALRRAQVVDL